MEFYDTSDGLLSNGLASWEKIRTVDIFNAVFHVVLIKIQYILTLKIKKIQILLSMLVYGIKV